MTPNGVLDYCLKSLDGVVLAQSWGESGIFYNPDYILKRGVYVLTVKEKDGQNDKGSWLDREGVFRVNVGLTKETFIKKFGAVPRRPAAGKTAAMDFDFTALDTIMPHPVYAWMGWVCVLNPSEETFAEFKPMIEESYHFALQKFAKRKR